MVISIFPHSEAQNLGTYLALTETPLPLEDAFQATHLICISIEKVLCFV